MGKASKKNLAKDRATPISKPVKPPADPELAALREKKILPVINDLTSMDTGKRTAAATAIANLIEDTKTRKLLLREQVVRILLEQTVTDSSLESKTAGWGILHNLAIEEEADFCIHLYRQDILTPLSSIIQMIMETIESKDQPVSKLPKAQQALVWSLSSSVIGLTSSLAEAQEEIVDQISKMPILGFLFGLLNVPSVPGELFSEVLACIATLTEDNEVLAQQVADNDAWLKGLVQLREGGGSRAVSTCAILHNIFSTLQWYDHNTPMAGASDAMLIPTLVQCMSQAQEKKKDTSNGGDSAILDPDQILKMALEITASIATSLQEALEHAAKGENEEEFEGFDEKDTDGDDVMGDDNDDGASDAEGSDRDDEGSDEEDEMTIEEMQADMDRVIGDGSDDEDDGEPVQATLDALINIATPAILAYLETDEISIPLSGCAISALNNIAWTISSIDFSEASSRLTNAWRPMAEKIWKDIVIGVLGSNPMDLEFCSTIAGLAWAVARSVQGKIGDLQAARLFMGLYEGSYQIRFAPDDAFTGLGVKCVGVLGRLALNPAPLEINQEVAAFLLKILHNLPNTPTADAIQALDELFDIYADKSYACDEIFWKNGFYKHLEEVKPKISKAAKAIDKRKETELRSRADEAVLNLTRFLSYKKKEQKQR